MRAPSGTLSSRLLGTPEIPTRAPIIAPATAPLVSVSPPCINPVRRRRSRAPYARVQRTGDGLPEGAVPVVRTPRDLRSGVGPDLGSCELQTEGAWDGRLRAAGRQARRPVRDRREAGRVVSPREGDCVAPADDVVQAEGVAVTRGLVLPVSGMCHTAVLPSPGEPPGF